MKILLKLIINMAIYFVFIAFLIKYNHYDGICFVFTLIAMGLCLIINILID